MEEIFDFLHGARYFTTLDMKSGYHQVELVEASGCGGLGEEVSALSPQEE